MNRLRRCRQALGLSQEEMARRLGVSRRYLIYQEQAPRPAKQISLAALGLTRLHSGARQKRTMPRRRRAS